MDCDTASGRRNRLSIAPDFPADRSSVQRSHIARHCLPNAEHDWGQIHIHSGIRRNSGTNPTVILNGPAISAFRGEIIPTGRHSSPCPHTASCS